MAVGSGLASCCYTIHYLSGATISTCVAGGRKGIEMCISTEIIIVKDGKLFLASVLSFVRPYLSFDPSFSLLHTRERGGALRWLCRKVWDGTARPKHLPCDAVTLLNSDTTCVFIMLLAKRLCSIKASAPQ